MGQAEQKKSSRAWTWVIIILLIMVFCCCLTLGGIYFYQRSQGQDSLKNLFSFFENEETVSQVVTAQTVETVFPVVTVQPANPASPSTQQGSDNVQNTAPLEPILVTTDRGVWMVNAYTNESAQLSMKPLDMPSNLQEGLSPDKKSFAYISGITSSPPNPSLVILDLQNMLPLTELELSGPLSQPTSQSEPGDKAFESIQAMQTSGSLAWSPDGQRLAFVAARDGDNADLYLYDLNSTAVTRLSNESEQAAELHWSPDGQFIEYVGVNSFGTGAGFDMAALWVYDILAQQPRLLEYLDSGGEEFIGWKDANTFYIHSWDRLCEATNLRSVNVVNAEQEIITDGCFTGIAYSPELKEGLLSVTDINNEYCTCGSPLDAGTYIFGEGLNLKKFQQVLAYSIGYVPEVQAFTIFGDGGLEYIYNDGGASLEIPPEVKGLKPYPSPSGDIWVWASYYSGKTGLWVTGNNMEPIEISPLYTGTPYWSEDGQTFYFIENDYLFWADASNPFGTMLLEVPSGTEMLELVK